MAEAGWTPDAQPPAGFQLLLGDRAARPPTPANLRAFMARALGALRQLDDSWPFREPVDAQDVPDYYDIVKVAAGTPWGRLKTCTLRLQLLGVGGPECQRAPYLKRFFKMGGVLIGGSLLWQERDIEHELESWFGWTKRPATACTRGRQGQLNFQGCARRTRWT